SSPTRHAARPRIPARRCPPPGRCWREYRRARGALRSRRERRTRRPVEDELRDQEAGGGMVRLTGLQAIEIALVELAARSEAPGRGPLAADREHAPRRFDHGEAPGRVLFRQERQLRPG